MKRDGSLVSLLLRQAWLVLAGSLLAACGSMPLERAPPGSFELSGQWLLDAEQSDALERQGFRSGFMIQDYPLLVTKQMRIEQDARSMGIEYGGGRYRDVSWGERRSGVWEVRAGWNDGDLYIFSDTADTSAIEIWQLSEGGDRLEINIAVKGDRTQEFQRVFRRSPKI